MFKNENLDKITTESQEESLHLRNVLLHLLSANYNTGIETVGQRDPMGTSKQPKLLVAQTRVL